MVKKPLDVLAQQMVATVASGTAVGKGRHGKKTQAMSEERHRVKRRCGNSFAALIHTEISRERNIEQLLEMLSEGVETRRSRRSAYIHRDRINGMLRPRRGARLTAITNGGAIPDTADYDVIEFPSETFVGTVNEDFAIESLAGDIFLLGQPFLAHPARRLGQSLGRRRPGLAADDSVLDGRSAGANAGIIQSGCGFARGRGERLADRAGSGAMADRRSCHAAERAAEQIVNYVDETVAMLGTVPTQERIIAERFFDEAGGMQLILHSPWGGRINRAWGLALRKRFCVSFDRELQAAATDDGICISLVEQHSFPLSDVFLMLKPAMLEENLTQAALGLADVRQPLALERDARSGDAALTAAARKCRWRFSACAPKICWPRFSRTSDVPRQPQRPGGASRSSAGQRNHRRLSARSYGYGWLDGDSRAHRERRDRNARHRYAGAFADGA